MAQEVIASVVLSLAATASKGLGLGLPSHYLSLLPSLSLTVGTGTGQANAAWHRKTELTSTPPSFEEHDLTTMGDGFFALDLSGAGPEQIGFSTIKVAVFHLTALFNPAGFGQVRVRPTFGGESLPWGNDIVFLNNAGAYAVFASDVGFTVGATSKLLTLDLFFAGTQSATVETILIGVA